MLPKILHNTLLNILPSILHNKLQNILHTTLLNTLRNALRYALRIIHCTIHYIITHSEILYV